MYGLSGVIMMGVFRQWRRPPVEAIPGKTPAAIDELADRLCAQAADLAAAEYQWLVTLREFDDLRGWAQQGAKSCSHWLSWACGMSQAMARDRIRVARALRDLPLVSAEFETGRLSFSKVRAICRVATEDNEQLLVDYGLSATAAHLERVCGGFRTARSQDLRAYEHDPADGGLDDPDELAVAETRWVRNRGSYDEGGVRFELRLPADAAAYFEAVLATVAQGLGEELVSGVQAHDDLSPGDQGVSVRRWHTSESHEARKADALVILAQTAQAHGVAHVDADQQTQINLVVNADALTQPADNHTDSSPTGDDQTQSGKARRPEAAAHSHTGDSHNRDGGRQSVGARQPEAAAHFADGPEVDMTTALRVACDASVVTLVEDAMGNPLGVGRKTRTIPAAIKRALRRRDNGCRFPGCTTRRFVDAHHVQHWAHGGPTDLDNLVLLCRFHHTLIHEGGFGIHARAPGQFSFSRPDRTPIPAARPATTADPGRYHDASHDRDPLSLIPDWDGTPPDFNLAIDTLDQATPKPDRHQPAKTSPR